MNMRRSALFFSISASVSGCAALENDLRKGVDYGLDSYQITHKVDQPGRKRVNARLWRAAMDTIGFVPLSRAEPATGVIETNWYSVPGTPTERSRMLVQVLGGDIRPDMLRVSVARQVCYEGAWVYAPTEAGVAQKLEEQILAKARIDKLVN